MQRARIISRICIAILATVFFGYVFNQHIPFTGVRMISYTFDRPHGAVGIFRPPVRYELIEGEKGRKIAKVIEDPLYFDIKTVIPYDFATVSFAYQKHTLRPVQLAVKPASGSEQFIIIPFYEEKRGDWIMGTATVDLVTAARQNSKYTFALSIPGLVANTTDEYVLVSRMNIRLTRPSLFHAFSR